MPAVPRHAVVDDTVVGTYHVSSRAVRRGFLLGYDSETGREHPHRKSLLLRRLELLESVFAVECLDWSVLDSSFDLMIRNRPDLVAQWTDQEVAARWLKLHRSQVELRSPAKSDRKLVELLRDEERLAKVRRRLSSVSWFMAYLKEPLAKRFNREDAVDGHFWAERFGCVRLPDEASRLACSSYVALNPLDVAGDERPGEATFECTSARAREEDDRSGDPARPASGWFAPLSLTGDGYAGAAAGRRPTDEGFLRLSRDEFQRIVRGLLERELAERAGREYSYEFPAELARLGITPPAWEAALQETRQRFARNWERAARLRREARRSSGGKRPTGGS